MEEEITAKTQRRDRKSRRKEEAQRKEKRYFVREEKWLLQKMGVGPGKVACGDRKIKNAKEEGKRNR